MKYRADGWIPDPPANYYAYTAPENRRKSLLSDLRPFSISRHDQGNTASCVAQAVVKALEIKRVMQLGKDAHVDLSRMQLWSMSREMMDPPRNRGDSGTYISFACDCLRRFGIAPEVDWPFDMDKIAMSPSWRSMRHAYCHRITTYRRITSTGQQRVQDCIAALAAGEPVVFGTVIGSNWFDYKPGTVLNIPTDDVGHHATVLEGWGGAYFFDENSWSRNWGMDGYCYLDPDVIASPDSNDFWTIQRGVEA
jgi:hypothetical protein